jgi:hypothetical protein
MGIDELVHRDSLDGGHGLFKNAVSSTIREPRGCPAAMESESIG